MANMSWGTPGVGKSTDGYVADGRNPLYGVKYPKNKAEFHEAIQRAYRMGREDGGEITRNLMNANFSRNQAAARVKALETISETYKTVGQAMHQLTQAMQSEAGQL